MVRIKQPEKGTEWQCPSPPASGVRPIKVAATVAVATTPRSMVNHAVKAELAHPQGLAFTA